MAFDHPIAPATPTDLVPAEALAEAQERLAVLADQAPDWDFWLAPDGHYRYVSPACEGICGYPAQAFLADPRLMEELLHPDDRPAWQSHLDGPAASGADGASHAAMELRLRTRDGQERWIEHRCRAVCDAKGRPLGRRGVNQDISARKVAEADTARITRLYATLTEFNQTLLHAPDEAALLQGLCRIVVETGGLKGCVVSLCDPDGSGLRPAVSAGLGPGLALAMPLGTDPQVGPSPPARAWAGEAPYACSGCDGAEFGPAWRAWAASAGVQTCYHEVIHRGEARVGLVSYLAATPEGIGPALASLLHELTEDLSFGLGYLAQRAAEVATRAALTEREARLAAMFQAAPVGILITSGRVIREVNDRLCELTGYPREALVGRSTRQFFADDAEFERVGGEMYPALVGGGRVSIESRLRRRDGQPLCGELTAVALDPTDLAAGVVATLLDLTAARSTQALLEARVALAAEAALGDLDHLMRFTLDTAERLTDSRIGFFHFVDPDQENLTLQSWSSRTLAEACPYATERRHCPISEAGVWVDCVRTRAPVVHNDYAALPHRKGLPEGHAPLVRELVVPVERDGLLVAILGVGNKPEAYTDADVAMVTQLAAMAMDKVIGLRAGLALREANTRLLEAQHLARVGDWRVELPGEVTRWSPQVYDILGLDPAAGPLDLEGVCRLLHPEDVARLRDDTARALLDGTPYSHDLRVLRPDGAQIHVHNLGQVQRGPDGAVTAVFGTVQDITERKLAEDRLRQAARVFESTSEGIVITDVEGIIQAVNPAFSAITGYEEAEVLGQTPRLLRSGRHDRDFYCQMWQALRTYGQWRGEVWNRRKGGEIYPEWLTISAVEDGGGQITHWVAVFSDITQIKLAQERLDFLAHHDALTGLPNRVLLHDRLAQAIRRASREGRRFAVLFLDLDGFKGVNDTLGHAAGDRLLEVVAQRLRARLRECDTLARLGGDEFLILLEGAKDDGDAAKAAADCLRLLGEAVPISGHEIFISGSIGIAIYPDDGVDPDALLRSADLAMYRAKAAGRNTFQCYTPELTLSARERHALENALRGALARGELLLHYQPQVELTSRAPCGVECLVRWRHQTLGLVPPGRFIPIAESLGIVAEIGDWVLREACGQLVAWRRAGIPVPRLAVNVSIQQLERPTLLPLLRELLADTGLPPADLELEVTESMLMGQSTRALATLDALRDLGVKLAVDDFGTGYSALGRLNRIPIDRLKIDASFVHDIARDPKDEAIARTIIGMGRDLGLEVIAEGVEREDQAEFLVREGCHFAQGYLFGRPMSALVLEQWWRQGGGAEGPSGPEQQQFQI